jgi:hypothetical protein
VRPVFLLTPLAALLLAGCGVSTTHSLEKTRTCVEEQGARVAEPRGDFVASTASAGAIRVYLDGPEKNFVTLSFGATADEALATAQGYDRFHGKNIGVSDILFTDLNVTLLWKLRPSEEDAALVKSCLK